VRGTVILCDGAQLVDGKLNITGAAWDRQVAAGPKIISVAAIIEVLREEASKQHALTIELLSTYGEPIMTGGVPATAQATFTVQMRDERLPVATVPIAATLPPLHLRSGLYGVRLCVNGRELDYRSFSAVRP
jgi:hypothetical protein